MNEHGSGCSEYDCQECQCLSANLQAILQELEQERTKTMYVEALLAESQQQTDKAHQVIMFTLQVFCKKLVYKKPSTRQP